MTKALVVLLGLWGLTLLGGDLLCEEVPGTGCAGVMPLWPALISALPVLEGTPPSVPSTPEAPLSRLDHPPIHPIHT